MCIYLRGRDVSVTKNGLHSTQVGAILDHMRSSGVPQHMRGSMTSRRGGSLANHLPDALSRQFLASTTNKQQRRISSLNSGPRFCRAFGASIASNVGRPELKYADSAS